MTIALFSQDTQLFLKALASETRQRIMQEFAGGEALSVNDVAARCGIGQSTASEQLAMLKQGGLVCAVKQGRHVQYRADAEAIATHLSLLQAYLSACCPPPAE
ncbi:ArsR/SmtB family transcription factor [Timonella sp. A28]|uniref:ArsR/SmtB family transcription factor n=1 Tax=Timonella sp. A28 TaxID=3442640 RepID=UPI003EBC9826